MTISAEYTEKATQNTRNQIQEEVVKPHLTSTVSIGLNSRDQSRNEEFASLFKALAIAVFLIFVVMAAQFESIKFSRNGHDHYPVQSDRCIWAVVAH